MTYPEASISNAFSYNTGSIINKYQIFNLVNMFNQNNLTGIQTIFGLPSGTATAFVSYLHMIFLQSIGGFTVTHTIYDWIWGYKDPFIQSLSQGNCFEGSQPYDPNIALRSKIEINDSVALSKNALPNMISSGYADIDTYRRITSYQGNSTVAVRRNIFDCKVNLTQYTNPWNTPKSDRIYGTDMFGFMPDVEINKSLSIFNPRLMRTQNYIFNLSYYFDNSYTILAFLADGSLLKHSTDYNINDNGLMNMSTVSDSPLLVSQFYYNGVDNKTVANLRLNGTHFYNYQKNITLGKLLVEMNTGTTVNYTNNLLYSIYYKNPFNFSSPTVFLPIMAVTENYSIPRSQYEPLFDSFSMKFVYAKYSLIIGVLLTMAFCAFSLIMCVGWQNRVRGDDDDSSMPNTQLLRDLSHDNQMISTINVPKSYVTLDHGSYADDLGLLRDLRSNTHKEQGGSRADFTLGDSYDGSRIDTGSRIEPKA